MNKKIISIIVLIVVALAGIIFWQRQRGTTEQEQTQNQTQSEPMAMGITGLEIPKRLADLRPVGIMIENHPDSRPQYGLSDADIVYEILAEGGITRHLALFQSKDPKSIGPVRSTRPYFNFLANQWSAVLAHSGGSDTALKELSIGFYRNLDDADEMLNGKYYSRDPKKFAPHNLFTSIEQLRKLADDRKITEWEFEPMFNYKAIPTQELKPTITEVTIPFSTASYLTKFQFDPTTNSYKRFLAGKPAVDQNNGLTIQPKNVLVQFAAGNVIPGDPKLAMEFRLDRSGKGFLFTGGTVAAITWKYQNGRLVYLDNTGNPLTIQPGPTWISILPTDQQNNVSWQ